MRNRGFTLMEMLVVLAIIGILAVAILVNYRAGEKQFILQRSASRLAQDIRLAENRAITTKEFKEDNISYIIHGIKFDATNNSSYTLIYCPFNTPENPIDIDRCKDKETINFEGKVKITALSADSESISSPLIIYFIPPDPKVVFEANGQVLSQAEVVIELNYEGGSNPQKISVNRAGLIEVK